MGLLDRTWRAIRATLNSWVSKAEDPEKILEQAVEDMQQDLIKMRQAVAQAIASQKRVERQADQAGTNAEEWKGRAQLALQKGNEELAREALQRRKTYQNNAEQLQQQLQQQTTVIEKLKRDMRALESKISEARSKKDMMVARARSAKASQQINEMLGGMGTGNSMSAFERMEEKVFELEAESEAAQSLGGDSLDEKFAALESGGDVDADMAEMKAQLGGLQSRGALPAGQEQEVDRELEALRAELDRT